MIRMKGILVIMSGLLLLGCSMNLKQPMNKIETYILEYDPPVISGLKSFPYVVRIERFSVAPVYNTTQMIYRDRAFNRDAYVYHRWRVNPADLVTYFLSRDMKHAGLFRAVISYDSRSKPSYILEGSVDEFVEWETEEQWYAVLTVDITLMAANEPDISKKILFQKSYSAREVCKKKSPRAYAESMSLAMCRISENVIRDVHDDLLKHHQTVHRGEPKRPY
jgi:ABC-type uncharacterized transport system auxiliary subunit